MGNAFKESGVWVHDGRMRGQHLGGTQVSIQRTQPESSLWTYAKCAKVILPLASISIFFLFCVYVPCESMCSICMQCSQVQSHQIPWNWSHTWSWASWYAWSSYKLLCNTEDRCVLLIKVCSPTLGGRSSSLNLSCEVHGQLCIWMCHPSVSTLYSVKLC